MNITIAPEQFLARIIHDAVMALQAGDPLLAYNIALDLLELDGFSHLIRQGFLENLSEHCYDGSPEALQRFLAGLQAHR